MGSSNSASALRSAMAVATWLKRRISRSMRRNAGLNRFCRCANTVLRLAPFHSRRWSGTCTENDMSDGAVSTPKASNSPMSCGYVRSL